MILRSGEDVVKELWTHIWAHFWRQEMPLSPRTGNALIALPLDSGCKQRRECSGVGVAVVVLVLEARVLRSQHQEGIVSLG